MAFFPRVLDFVWLGGALADEDLGDLRALVGNGRAGVRARVWVKARDIGRMLQALYDAGLRTVEVMDLERLSVADVRPLSSNRSIPA